MERNSRKKLFDSKSRDFSSYYKSPENKNIGASSYNYNQSTRSSIKEMVSPTCQAKNLGFTNTLRKSSIKGCSKIRLKTNHSMSLSTNIYSDNNDKYPSNRPVNSIEKLNFQNSAYGENSIYFKIYFFYFL